MKSGFIYEWFDITTELKYIGRHEGHTGDGYIGSGTMFNEQYSQRPTDFIRSIIWYSDNTSSEEIAEREFEILSKIPEEELYFGKNRKYYNVVNNSYGYTSASNPMKNLEVVAKMMATRSKKGNNISPWHNTVQKYGLEEAKRMQALPKEVAAKNGRNNKGILKSEDHKKKISESITLVNKNRKNKTDLGRKQLTSLEELIMLYTTHKTFKEAAKVLGITEDAFKGRYYLALKKGKI